MFSYNKEKLNYGLSIMSTAAALGQNTEFFFAGENVYNIMEISYLKKNNRKSFLSFSNSEELVSACKELGTSFSVCSAAIATNNIDAKFIRKDLEISISGITSIISKRKNETDLLFV